MKFFLISLCLLLGACGIIKDRSSEYSEAKIGKTLVIPAGYSDNNINSSYPIPVINNKRALDEEFELPKPPNATAALDSGPYVIETVEGQTWLRLFTAPGKVWPLLDFFWTEFGIKVEREVISEGFVATHQIDSNKSDDPKASSTTLSDALSKKFNKTYDLEGARFQAKLEQGVRRNTSEIQLRALTQGHVSSSDEWVSVAVNSELENNVLILIGEFITSDALQNRYSLLANDIGGDSRIHLLQDDSGQSYLKLNLLFQRAWNEVGKSLALAGVIVSDLDVSEKTYFVSYLNEDDIDNWYSTSDSIQEKGKEHNFSIKLEEGENGDVFVRVEILNEKFDSQLANELLSLIFEHIS